ncbi:HipA family kinase [Granulicella sp. dw_53]|uniref:HipA family kinase n=1 Tax=Granulicella sp. dw_53 TaxID=2719792 RepID=UPI001BD2A10D|nr:HipA family kinase [Granulicella sp. dw_53]
MGLVEINPFHMEEYLCSTVSLSAVKFVRKMKGGSQSILVQCDDGRFYVVKMIGNPQGANILSNEFLGSAIGAAVGLPVTEGRIIHISNSFLDGEPEAWFESQSGRRRPDAGLHFGSLLVGQPFGSERPNEYFSRSKVSTIANRNRFLGMYILDIWANHQDNRQAIFLPGVDGRSQAFFFIDHGHMFGGPNWIFQERPGGALHLESSIYDSLWNDDIVSSWISHFRKTVPEVLNRIPSIIPARWYNGNLQRLVDTLTHRLARLTELVEAEATTSRLLMQRSSENEKM